MTAAHVRAGRSRAQRISSPRARGFRICIEVANKFPGSIESFHFRGRSPKSFQIVSNGRTPGWQQRPLQLQLRLAQEAKKWRNDGNADRITLLESNQQEIWSGRGDLNARPLRPKGAKSVPGGPYRSSRISNVYNNPGSLLSLKEQVLRMEWIAFGHCFGTAEWGDPRR
jgi:hypothetical protein